MKKEKKLSVEFLTPPTLRMLREATAAVLARQQHNDDRQQQQQRPEAAEDSIEAGMHELG